MVMIWAVGIVLASAGIVLQVYSRKGNICQPPYLK
uniref:Uncharacterized protein n=1 Tax=Anguilla anguilla TaxID=7936 RepID=A0A0E9SH34_ANGAN